METRWAQAPGLVCLAVPAGAPLLPRLLAAVELEMASALAEAPEQGLACTQVAACTPVVRVSARAPVWPPVLVPVQVAVSAPVRRVLTVLPRTARQGTRQQAPAQLTVHTVPTVPTAPTPQTVRTPRTMRQAHTAAVVSLPGNR